MRKKLLLILIAILIVVLGVLGFYLSRRESVISKKQAIAKVEVHFGDDFYKVEQTELRKPTSREAYSIQSFGHEPPNLVWVVKVRLSNSLAIVLIDAHTGEILPPIGLLV